MIALNVLFWSGTSLADVDDMPDDNAQQTSPPPTAPAPAPTPTPEQTPAQASDQAPDQAPAPTADAAPADSTDPNALPEIEAKIYHLRPIKISNGRKSYVFEKLPDPEGTTETAPPDTESEPTPEPGQPRKKGKVILLRQEGENIMALRILQEDKDKNQIYARRAQRYNDHDELVLGSNYLGIEKLMDLAPFSGARKAG